MGLYILFSACLHAAMLNLLFVVVVVVVVVVENRRS
jgi:hypothetical protein